MFVLPLQSPKPVPVNGDAAPAAVISLKSQLDKDSAAAVIVLAVPTVSDLIKNLRISLPPLAVNVPLTVWLAPTVIIFIDDDDADVNDRLLNVFAPVIVRDVALVLAKLTL